MQQCRRLAHRVLLVLTATLVLSCSGDSREWQAATAAQAYYEQLAQGNAVRFLEGKAGVEQLPADYCEQLLKAVEQYHEDMQEKHGGLSHVRISDNTLLLADTAKVQPVVKAFLILCYSDSTQEEIVVPMVEAGGEWRMK